MPATFRDAVALFAANREGGLYAQLCEYVHVVRFEPGKLEVRLEKGAAKNLVNRLGHCLSTWTGRRWMASVVDQPGAPTLAEEERKAEEEHQARVRAHPLMRAVFEAFPEAKIASLKPKEVVPAAPVAKEKIEEFLPEPETEEDE